MIISKDIAKITAKKLLSIEAIKLSLQKPFQWSSGWKSPIYCDNRMALSEVSLRGFLKKSIAEIISKNYEPDIIAGVATGAIAIGVLVAEKLGLPFIYVRPEPKKHGRQNQIEGKIEKGKKIVVVEDLISTGKSSLTVVKALQNVDCEVLGMVAIFNYGFEVANENFKNDNIPLTTLSNYEYLLQQALEGNFICERDLGLLKKWQEHPQNWK